MNQYYGTYLAVSLLLGSYSMVSGDDGFDPTDSSHYSMTFEHCLRTLGGTFKPKTLDRAVRWIHFPKCGTSFGAAIYGYVCQSTAPSEETVAVAGGLGGGGSICDYCGIEGRDHVRPVLWDPQLRKLVPFKTMPYCDPTVPRPQFPFTNHFPHVWNWGKVKFESEQAAVALFRDPRKRVVSAWNNNKHAYGIGSFNWPYSRAKAREMLEKETKTVEEFAQHPAISSCQAKMLLGEYCGERLNITLEMVQEAERRVLNMAFVGLTDAFNASVCLFHHQFGGKPEEWMFKSAGGIRSGEILFKHNQDGPLPGIGERVHPNHWKKIPLDWDPIDWRIYSIAREVFVSRLRKYGMI